LNKIAKLIRANEQRTTRFHTARGELMPLDAWFHFPQLLWERGWARISEAPWMVPAAVAFLNERIRRDWQIVELGSGLSTSWYARRAAAVISLEDNSGWYAKVKAHLEREGIGNCDLRLVELESFQHEVRRLPDESFNLVIVDSNENHRVSRVGLLRAAANKLVPGGLIILDDSDKPEYGDADSALPDWDVRRFVGMKSTPLMALETTVYQRPVPQDVTRQAARGVQEVHDGAEG
jgi:predicted O-methyltransferase YrrM